MAITPEYWQRGPVDGINALLQPVAHALLQARDEVTEMLQDFPIEKLWERPAGLASVGFHLRHLTGILDRLFTYADARNLSEAQFTFLKQESETSGEESVEDLVSAFQKRVGISLEWLKTVDENKLTEVRTIGRAKIPSTVLGLLFHAAEHTMRHTGQLLVTSKWVNA